MNSLFAFVMCDKDEYFTVDVYVTAQTQFNRLSENYSTTMMPTALY